MVRNRLFPRWAIWSSGKTLFLLICWEPPTRAQRWAVGALLPKAAAWFFSPGSEACASPLTPLTTFNWLYLLSRVLWRTCTSPAMCLCNKSSKQHQTILRHQWHTGHSAKVRGILGHKANSRREEPEAELAPGTINVLSCISQNERCLPNEQEHDCWVLEGSSLGSIPAQTPQSRCNWVCRGRVILQLLIVSVQNTTALLVICQERPCLHFCFSYTLL